MINDQFEYQKHNSFVKLIPKRSKLIENQVNRARIILKRPELTTSDNIEHSMILAEIKDIFLSEANRSVTKFQISENVAEELRTLNDIDVPAYLVHRYRYEIFPEKKKLDEYPPYLQIEPSSICNYRCVFCFETDKFFTRKSNGYMGHMPLDTFKLIIDQAEGNIEFISLASRGEPLLCPEIEGMLSYTRDKFLNLKMNTNASLLDEKKAHAILQSGLKTLVFSADAAEEPLYSKLRVGGNLENVINNITRFQEIRTTQYPSSKIITRVSGVKISSDQNFEKMQQVWGDLVDQVAFVSYNPWEQVYMTERSSLMKPCSDLWRRMFIWWDGKVNPCDVDYRSTLSVGNIHNKNISQLWRSSEYEELRSKHLNGNRGSKEPCNRCSVV